VRGRDAMFDGLVRAYGGASLLCARRARFKMEMTYNLLNSEVSGKWDWHDGSGRAPSSATDDLGSRRPSG